jgi:hypothetical protein
MNKRVYNALRKVAGDDWGKEGWTHIIQGWNPKFLLPWSSPDVPGPTAPIPSAVERHQRYMNSPQRLHDQYTQGVNAARQFLDENPDINDLIPNKWKPQIDKGVNKGDQALQKLTEIYDRNPGIQKGVGKAKEWWNNRKARRGK